MKRPIKSLFGHLTFASHLGAVLLGNAAVVVAFHRVQDIADSNGLTIGPEMFERYCRFFMRHFRLISLRDLVDRMERGQELNRHLAITFDDGYRDNFENAAPVLEKLSLPATFFVVSQWIGSDVVPWWDREQGVRHPWMSWDQVRSLHRKGFDIGAHTRHHVDLGSVTGTQASEEICGSKIELENQLSSPVDLFAFPYGRPNNLVDENRALVQAAGFRCCCSCFGGINDPEGDPFRLARVPISPWFSTPHQFGLEIALGMSDASS
jgi:peptidoglycan/xylan/chitin deacetylase (PgdA/CDA1 family)